MLVSTLSLSNIYIHTFLSCFSYYIRDSKGKLQNTPYVDNSYKWAGGGFLSTVGDLVKIGNIMLYSSQCEKPLQHLKGICLFFTYYTHRKCSLSSVI